MLTDSHSALHACAGPEGRRDRLQRRITHLYAKTRNRMTDMHHKAALYLTHPFRFRAVLLPKLETSRLARRRPPRRRNGPPGGAPGPPVAAAAAGPAGAASAPGSPPPAGPHRVIDRRTTAAMLSLGHYKFRQRLIAKAQLVGCHVVHPDESYTTQGCTRCGHRQAMGGRRTYVCASCGLRIDRDINSARNILLKTLWPGGVRQAP